MDIDFVPIAFDLVLVAVVLVLAILVEELQVDIDL